ncbi:MAG: hypothetical protein IJD35_00250 [Clostridia bacterium]|nr:hypothetical protein [Clostridia bacterium]
MKRIVLTLAILLVFVLALVSCGSETTTTSTAETTEAPADIAKYEEALSLLEKKDYEGARSLLKELGDFRDAKEQLSHFIYVPTNISRNDVMQIEYTYNDENFLVKIAYIMQGETVYYYDFVYDENHRLTETTLVNPNGQNESIAYTYDENGNLTKETYLNDNGVFREEIYDENGRKIERIIKSGNGQYVYDEDGKLTKYYLVEADGKIDTVEEYFYDANGNLIKETYTTNDNTYQTITEYSYDANGYMIQETDTVNSRGTEFKQSVDFIYDANGNMVKAESKESGEVVQTFLYEYKLVYFPSELSGPMQDFLSAN